MKKESKGKSIAPWRSPLVMWVLSGFFLVVFLMGQTITVIPHEDMNRDSTIFNVVILAACITSGVQALRSRRKKEKA